MTVGKAIINAPKMHGKTRQSEMSLKIKPNSLSVTDKPLHLVCYLDALD